MLGEIRVVSAVGENIVNMTNTERHRSKGLRQRSEFSNFIAATYFIPGITGRARCLQGCEPNALITCCDIVKVPRLPPPASPARERGQCPEPPPNAWEVERRSRRSSGPATPKAVWAETASFLRLDEERESKGGVSQETFATTYTTKRKNNSHVRQSDCCDNSLSTPSTILSDFYNVSARTSSVCNSNQSENKRASRLHHNQVGESELISAVRDKWKQYECEERSSDRRSTLNEELGSIQALLARQRARTSTHRLTARISQRSNKNPAICRAHSTRTLYKQSFQKQQNEPYFRSSRNLGNNDDLSSLDLPPLMVTFKSRTSFKTIHASPA
jgi:hypothetical protein